MRNVGLYEDADMAEVEGGYVIVGFCQVKYIWWLCMPSVLGSLILEMDEEGVCMGLGGCLHFGR